MSPSLKRLFAFLFLLPFVACGYPQVRVKNDSPYRLDDVRMYCGEVVRTFGTLAPGVATAYSTVGDQGEFHRIEAQVEGRALSYEPSAVGNRHTLEAGFYTYRIRVERDTSVEGGIKLRFFLSRDAYPPD